MPLGVEVSLGQGHIVLDGLETQPAPEKSTAAPLFSADVYCSQSPISATAEHLLLLESIVQVVLRNKAGLSTDPGGTPLHVCLHCCQAEV